MIIRNWHRVDMRIPFRDVDSWGLVWHGHYFSYVDAGRLALLHKFDIPFTDFRQLGFLMPVVNVNMDLRAPGRADEPIVVDTAMVRVRGALIETHFRITHDDKVLARGTTQQAFTRPDGALLYHVPDVVADKFEAAMSYALGA